MKNIKTFMLSTAAAICLTSGVAIADSNSYAQPNEQQREYRTPLKEMNMNNTNEMQNRDYQNQGARNYDDQRQYRANTADNNIRWGSNTTQQARLNAGELQQVQRSLRNAGHTVSVDGIWGPETASAVRNFQEERDLTVTGRLDTDTLSALDVSLSHVNSNNR